MELEGGHVVEALFAMAEPLSVPAAPGVEHPSPRIRWEHLDAVLPRAATGGVDGHEAARVDGVVHLGGSSVACYTNRVQGPKLENIERELRQLVDDERRRWQRIALLLMQVEREDLWRGHAPSFTAWLRGLGAREEGPDQTRLLVRHLVAGRFYEELRRQHRRLPALGEASATPAPLELVRKMRRAMPADVVEPLVLQAAEGRIGRPQLERVWKEFRPALGGKTSRGRGPGVDAGDVDEDLLARGRLLEEIRTRGPLWLGQVKYQLHPDVQIDKLTLPVVATRTAAGVELHALELWPTQAMVWKQGVELKRLGKLVEPLWVVASSAVMKEARAVVPRHVGLVEAERLAMVRMTTRQDAEATARLALAVLGRMHGW